MTNELKGLLEAAKGVKLTDAELEEHRILIAAANGHISDKRITEATVRASKTLIDAASMPKKD